jgi:putative endonuclease
MASSDPAMRGAEPSPDRIARYRRGRLSEWVAAAALLAWGYRILGRRVRTPHGEIDLIAVRGRRLAFVEVKRRAAEFWVSRHAAFREHDRGLDAMLVVPGRLPIYLPDALHGTAPRQR